MSWEECGSWTDTYWLEYTMANDRNGPSDSQRSSIVSSGGLSTRLQDTWFVQFPRTFLKSFTNYWCCSGMSIVFIFGWYSNYKPKQRGYGLWEVIEANREVKCIFANVGMKLEAPQWRNYIMEIWNSPYRELLCAKFSAGSSGCISEILAGITWNL